MNGHKAQSPRTTGSESVLTSQPGAQEQEEQTGDTAAAHGTAEQGGPAAEEACGCAARGQALRHGVLCAKFPLKLEKLESPRLE